jgi:hypothetical protein
MMFNTITLCNFRETSVPKVTLRYRVVLGQNASKTIEMTKSLLGRFFLSSFSTTYRYFASRDSDLRYSFMVRYCDEKYIS